MSARFLADVQRTHPKTGAAATRRSTPAETDPIREHNEIPAHGFERGCYGCGARSVRL